MLNLHARRGSHWQASSRPAVRASREAARRARRVDLPLRERNALLTFAAGFRAPAYAERRLDDPELAPVRRPWNACPTHARGPGRGPLG
ncbi:hypothetical protein HBB16_17405 [Pseudonocardia sp. MCCB 268]|nr:hypothetical protein [Pseudonocardia cytotoxica]